MRKKSLVRNEKVLFKKQFSKERNMSDSYFIESVLKKFGNKDYEKNIRFYFLFGNYLFNAGANACANRIHSQEDCQSDY